MTVLRNESRCDNIVLTVTPIEKKICETAVDQQSGRSVRTLMSQIPMYSLIPSEEPSRETALPRKTNSKTIGKPIVKYVIRPVHLVPPARQPQMRNQVKNEYPTFGPIIRVGSPSSLSVFVPMISSKKYVIAAAPVTSSLAQGASSPNESKKA